MSREYARGEDMLLFFLCYRVEMFVRCLGCLNQELRGPIPWRRRPPDNLLRLNARCREERFCSCDLPRVDAGEGVFALERVGDAPFA